MRVIYSFGPSGGRIFVIVGLDLPSQDLYSFTAFLLHQFPQSFNADA